GTLECRGRYPPAPHAASVSRDDAIDACIELFASAIAKRPPTDDAFAVPISGGRDSRHILLELHRTGHRPATCISLSDQPPDLSRDAVVAAALCKALNFNHVIVDPQPEPAASMRWNRE